MVEVSGINNQNTHAPRVSVVIPIYNVEKYLPECIESIESQTLEDIEIILVDDGSPDASGEIAEAYAKRDYRIKVIHRENGGLGPARNSGIDAATGEYVGFVDSDDWVEPCMYEHLYAAAIKSGAPIVYGGIKSISRSKVVDMREQPFAGSVLHGEEIFEYRRAFFGAPISHVKDDPIPLSVCTAIFRRSFLNDNGIRFPTVRSEDKFFNNRACRSAHSVACIAGTDYCYRKDGQASITRTFHQNTLDSFFELFRQLYLMADEEPLQHRDECQKRADRCVIDYCRVLIGMIECSSESVLQKRAFAAEVLSHPTLRQACKGFPFWKLPSAQAIFFVCLKLRMAGISLLLSRIKAKTM